MGLGRHNPLSHSATYDDTGHCRVMREHLGTRLPLPSHLQLTPRPCQKDGAPRASPVILGMPSSRGTGSRTMTPWSVPTQSRPWQIRRLVTHSCFWPAEREKPA